MIKSGIILTGMKCILDENFAQYLSVLDQFLANELWENTSDEAQFIASEDVSEFLEAWADELKEDIA